MRFKNGCFLVSITVLLASLLYKLIDYSKIISNFPLDYINDMSSYMAQLYFLDTCGFHNYCSYWYNGFVSFLASPPGWYFFTYPILKLVGSVNLAFYISMVILFVIAFLVVYYFGRLFNWGRLERILFFFVIFSSPLAIGDFLRAGRLHEMTGWIAFIVLALCFLYYKDNKIDRKSVLLSFVYAFMIISNFAVAVLGSIALSGILLVKKGKELMLILSIFVLGALLSAFWWVPFVLNISKSYVLTKIFSDLFIREGVLKIKFFLVVFGFLIFLYLFFKYIKTKKDKLFFAPVTILFLVFVLNFAKYVFFLKGIDYGPYVFLIMFYIMFFAFEVKLFDKKLISILLVIFAVLSGVYSIYYIPEFVTYENSTAKVEIDTLLYSLDDSEKVVFYFDGNPDGIYGKALYSYLPVVHNLSTPFGWYPHLTSNEYLEGFRKIFTYEECDDKINALKEYNVTAVVASKVKCNELVSCGLKLKSDSEDFCIIGV